LYYLHFLNYHSKYIPTFNNTTRNIQSCRLTFISGMTGGGQGSELPPGKLHVKTGPQLSLYFGISFSVGCCFFAFFGVFSGYFRL